MSLKSALTPAAITLLVVVLALGTRGMWLPPQLGPKDGHDLPPIDLDRVAIGDVAPDFSLEALSGGVLTLSEFRGRKNVVLVFYRGHW